MLAKLSIGYKTIQSVSKKYIRDCRPSLLQYAILCRLLKIDESFMDPIAKERLKILIGGRAGNASSHMDGAKIQKRYNQLKRDINVVNLKFLRLFQRVTSKIIRIFLRIMTYDMS